MSKLFVVSAPSGGGKTTVITQVIQQVLPVHPIERVITYTTRTPRITDRAGIDYHFVTEHEFRDKINQNFFLEYSDAYGTLYGTPRTLLDKLEQNIAQVAIVDCAGVRSIVREHAHAVTIWLDAPSLDTLAQRLAARNTEDQHTREHRLTIAQQELLSERNNPLYHYTIVNNVLQETVQNITEIILHELRKQ